MNIKSLAFIIAAGLLSFSISYGQCKGFTKKKCLPILDPYISNGQLNSAVLLNGESAELEMTFYSGQEYRVATCTDGRLGKIEFSLLSKNGKPLLETKNHAGQEYWDFKLKATQQLIVRVKVPAVEDNVEVVPSGCVSVLVGFKNKEEEQ